MTRAGVGLLLSLVAVSLPMSAARGAPVEAEVYLQVIADGIAPFDSDDTPGSDSAADNGIVRTFDEVTVRIDWNLNEGDATNVVVASSLPAGMTWVTMPPECSTSPALIPLSSISGGELVCNLGDQAEGSNGSMVGVIALGSVNHGTVLAFTATVEADGVPQATSDEVSVTASAAPKINVDKGHPAAMVFKDVPNADGSAIGRVFYFPITVEVGGSGKGSEPIASTTLELTDDYSAIAAVAPSITPLTWTIPDPLNSFERCGPTDGSMPQVPYGRIGLVAAATPLNSVVESGTWTCTAGVGSTVDIDITGADLAPASFPTADTLASPITGSVLVSGQVAFWISDADLTGILGGPVGVGALPDNVVSWRTTPIGVSGGANVGEDPADDAMQAGFSYETPGNWNSHYVGLPHAVQFDLGFGQVEQFNTELPPGVVPNYLAYVPTQTQEDNVGDGTVVAGQAYAHKVMRRNTSGAEEFLAVCSQIGPGQSLAPLGDYPVANVVDLATFVAGGPFPQSTRTAGDRFVGELAFVNTWMVAVEIPGGINLLADTTADDDGDFIIEYSADAFTDGDCNSDYSWSTTPPADLTTVTMVRALPTSPSQPGERINLVVNLVADAGTPGDVLWVRGSHAAWSTGVFDPAAEWEHGDEAYEGATLPHTSDNDRLTLTGNYLEITKTVSSGQSAGLLGGDTVSFDVVGTVVGAPPGTAENVSIIDFVPEGLSYVAESGVPAPISIEDCETAPGTYCTASGATDGSALVWSFGSVVNGTVNTVAYDTTVDTGAAPFSVLSNIAWMVGDTDSGTGLEALAPVSANAAVQTSGTYSAANIFKAVAAPLVEVDSTMEFILEYANVGTEDLSDVRLIDVLPYVGDGREPASAFSGTIAIDSVTTAAGEAVWYTVADPSTIVNDPDDPSNLAGGSTVWCEPVDTDPTIADFGSAGCPAVLADATAFYVDAPAVLVPGQSETIVVRLAAAGNADGDIYTNEFGGRVTDIVLPIRSNDVPVTVIGIDLAVDKEVVSPESEIVNLDGEVVFEVRVGNEGSQDATGVEVADYLPTGLVFVSADNGGTVSGTPGVDEIVTWSGLSVPAGTELTLLVTGRAIGADLVNYAEVVGADQGSDPDSEPGDPSEPLGPANPPDQDDEDWNQVVLAAQIGGTVWIDADEDGQQGGSESPVGGVEVLLYVDANGDGQPDDLDADGLPDAVGTTTTDADGRYLFDGLYPSNYLVAIDTGVGDFTTQNVGDDATDSDVDPSSGWIPVTAVSGEANDDNDAGIIPDGLFVGDLVWNDLDGDGVQDPDEPGVAGVEIEILDADGIVVGSATTGPDGSWIVGGLAPGDYQIRVVSVPDGFIFVPAGQGGDPALDSEVDATGLSPVFSLTESNTDLDIGIEQAGLSIGDLVWDDLDGDGIQDPGEPGVGGVTLTLLDADGEVVATTTTAADGSWMITGLDPGEYELVVTDIPDGYAFVLPGRGDDSGLDSDVDLFGSTGLFDLTESTEGLDVGVTPGGTLGDHAWLDLDGDGELDPGEPALPGTQIQVFTADGELVATLTADANGNYSLQVPPGDYYVVASVAGYPDYTSAVQTVAAGAVVDTLDAPFLAPSPATPPAAPTPATPPSPPTPSTPERLPVTGAEALRLLAVAALLVSAGLVAIRLRRH